MGSKAERGGRLMAEACQPATHHPPWNLYNRLLQPIHSLSRHRHQLGHQFGLPPPPRHSHRIITRNIPRIRHIPPQLVQNNLQVFRLDAGVGSLADRGFHVGLHGFREDQVYHLRDRVSAGRKRRWWAYRFDFIKNVVKSGFLQTLDFLFDKRHVVHQVFERLFIQLWHVWTDEVVL